MFPFSFILLITMLITACVNIADGGMHIGVLTICIASLVASGLIVYRFYIIKKRPFFMKRECVRHWVAFGMKVVAIGIIIGVFVPEYFYENKNERAEAIYTKFQENELNIASRQKLCYMPKTSIKTMELAFEYIDFAEEVSSEMVDINERKELGEVVSEEEIQKKVDEWKKAMPNIEENLNSLVSFIKLKAALLVIAIVLYESSIFVYRGYVFKKVEQEEKQEEDVA